MDTKEELPEMTLCNDLVPEELGVEVQEAQARAVRVDRWLNRNRTIAPSKVLQEGDTPPNGSIHTR